MKLLLLISFFFSQQGKATEANGQCFECSNPKVVLSALTNPACEVLCAANQCEQYFSSADFTCTNYCSTQTVFEKSTNSLLKCAKGATWNVAKGIVMSPIAIWNAMIASIDKSSEFIDFCESNMPCKRQLAFEAAFLKDSTCTPHTDDELKEVFTADLIRKRANVRQMAERDPNYQAQLRKCKIPLPNLDTNEAPIDAVYAYILKSIADAGIKWECYNAADRAEMVCEAVGALFIPTGVGAAAKFSETLAIKLARYTPKSPKGPLHFVTSTVQRWDQVRKLLSRDFKGVTVDNNGKLVVDPQATGRMAVVIAQTKAKHGTEFYVDNSLAGKARAVARGKDIALSPAFIKDPDLGTLLHEIKHTTRTRKKDGLIGFLGVEHQFKDRSLHKAYGSYFREDELEARIPESRALKNPDGVLKKAREFAREQKKLINNLLESIQTGGEVKNRVFQKKPRIEYLRLLDDEKTIVVRKNVATKWDHFAWSDIYITFKDSIENIPDDLLQKKVKDILAKRLKEVESLEKSQLSGK